MTEKRFRVSKVFELNNPFPIYDRDCPLTQKEASDLLNELADENEQLKQQINKLQFNKAKGQQAYQKRLSE